MPAKIPPPPPRSGLFNQNVKVISVNNEVRYGKIILINDHRITLEHNGGGVTILPWYTIVAIDLLEKLS